MLWAPEGGSLLGAATLATLILGTVLIGAQLGGAVKNVLAIACGIVQGRGLGDNTRAALVTRGLAEMIRLGTAKGARPETLAGLSGLGDLALTCNAMQSRNFSLGVALGDGTGIAFPELAAEFSRRVNGDVPADFVEKADAYIAKLQANPDAPATRKASQNALNAFGPLLPELLGGSADLAGSNLTIWSGSKGVDAKDASGNYIYYGVREFGMAAIMNGIALHGGFVPYGATFLIFMEYCRNAVRMAALLLAVCAYASASADSSSPAQWAQWVQRQVSQLPASRAIQAVILA